jgi:hypothetical protein
VPGRCKEPLNSLQWLASKMPAYREESNGVISVALYTAAECKTIVGELRRLEGWKAALVRHAESEFNYQVLARPEVRSARTLNSPPTAKFHREFDARMNSVVKPLIQSHWRIDLADHSGTHLLRYGPGDHYVPHHDTGPGLDHRYLSIVCYLNDDFAGGQTSFPGLDYSVTPEAGKAIVFPSNYLHGSEPITSGEKFVIVSWVIGPNPVKWI